MTAVLDDGVQPHLVGYGVHRIGRDSRRCEIVYSDELVSRVHAWLIGSPGEWWLLDNSSSNGIQVNGQMVDGIRLKERDRIQIGGADIEFRFATREEAERARTAFPEGPPPDPLEELLCPDLARLRILRSVERPSEAVRLGLLQSACSLALSEGLQELGRLCVLAREMLAADRVLFFRPGPERPEAVALVDGEGYHLEPGSHPVRSRLAARALEEGRVLFTRDLYRDPRFGRRDGPRRENIGSAMAAPLRDGEDLLGVLLVDNRLESDWFEEDDRLMLAAFAPFAARAIQGFGIHGPPDEEA